MKSGLEDVTWVSLSSISDERGSLTAIESGLEIPFEIKRVFYIHDVISDRGGHAHRNTDQIAIGIAGSHTIEVKDAQKTRSFTLDDPAKGLFLPRMTFTHLLDFSPGAVSLVLASTHYDRSRSLRTFDEYLRALEEE